MVVQAGLLRYNDLQAFRMKAYFDDHRRIRGVFAMTRPDIIIDMNPQFIAFDVQVSPSVHGYVRKEFFPGNQFRQISSERFSLVVRDQDNIEEAVAGVGVRRQA